MTTPETLTGTQFKLKPLSKEGIEAAIAKAEQYRLLNQPELAESICLDIQRIDSGHQRASVILLLSLTDQFGHSSSEARQHALKVANGLTDEYARLYYKGIVHERQGSAAISSHLPGADFDAYEWYLEAMELYEKAENVRPAGNDDTILRWNTCARLIMQHHLKPRPLEDRTSILE